MSNQTAQLIDDEIKTIVEGGLNRAKHLLTEHVDQLHLLAGALLEYETLSGDEIKKLIAGDDIGPRRPGSEAIGSARWYVYPQDAPSQRSVRCADPARGLTRTG